jgi:hypothetical protein
MRGEGGRSAGGAPEPRSVACATRRLGASRAAVIGNFPLRPQPMSWAWHSVERRTRAGGGGTQAQTVQALGRRSLANPWPQPTTAANARGGGGGCQARTTAPPWTAATDPVLSVGCAACGAPRHRGYTSDCLMDLRPDRVGTRTRPSAGTPPPVRSGRGAQVADMVTWQRRLLGRPCGRPIPPPGAGLATHSRRPGPRNPARRTWVGPSGPRCHPTNSMSRRYRW